MVGGGSSAVDVCRPLFDASRQVLVLPQEQVTETSLGIQKSSVGSTQVVQEQVTW